MILVTIRMCNFQKVQDLLNRVPSVQNNPNPSFGNIEVTEEEQAIISHHIYTPFNEAGCTI